MGTSPESIAGQPVHALRRFLREGGQSINERWRQWAHGLVDIHGLTPQLTADLWREVLDFDPALAGYAAEPLPVAVPAVLVAGSGKETFKTFNVSTAAGILAAASGAYVVKGVSRSVSAVTGSADVLDMLGLPVTGTPEKVPQRLERDRIAFIRYSAFCPAYASRYDGVFSFLNPFSFFMPAAVLAIRASGFVYGIAHADVSLAVAAIRAARPDLQCGAVVATELSGRELIDERASYGISHTAMLDGTRAWSFRDSSPPAPGPWRAAVAHRGSHRDNAALLASSLAPGGCAACAELVDQNAALILAVSQRGQIDEASALTRVRDVRLSGGAVGFLSELRDRQEAPRAA